MIDLRMVAPSFVIWTCPPPIGCRILSIPFGPSVVLTRSQIANAPMKDAMRLFSPVSRCAPSSSTVGIESPNILRHAQGGIRAGRLGRCRKRCSFAEPLGL